MNLDELQSVRDRERQSDSLQQLRESFYADVGDLVRELRQERDAAAERADDPFDDQEVNRLTDDINTAEQTVEAIYERRVGKLVKMASFAAADMPVEDEGLTAEERDLFEDLVGSIEANRGQVMGVIDGEVSSGGGAGSVTEDAGTADASPASQAADTPAGADAEPSTQDGVDAADLMGGDGADPTASPPDAHRPEEAPPDHPAPDDVPPDHSAADDAAPAADHGTGVENEPGSAQRPPSDDVVPEADVSPGQETASDAETTATAGGGPEAAGTTTDATVGDEEPTHIIDGDDVDRTTVRITRDVGEIFGVDEREYDLSTEDVVTLPAANAEPLVEQDAAEPID